MNKEEFLSAVALRLRGLPQYDIDRSLDYYREMIEDRMEDGMSEQEAVANLGSVDDAVEQILSTISLARIATERVKPKSGVEWWMIVLAVLGFPLWFGLLMGVFGIFVGIFACAVSLIIALFALVLSLGAMTVYGFWQGAVSLLAGEAMQGLFYTGAGIAGIGLTILSAFAAWYGVKGAARLSKKFVLWIKGLFVGKGRV